MDVRGTSTMNHWVIVHTKPNRERSVAVQLHQRALQVYLPLVWVNPVNPRAARERPYFPGYLFAQIDERCDWLEIIRWAHGLKEVVRSDGDLVSVSHTFVDELKERLAQIRAVSGISAGDRPPGTAPLIADGPFSGFEGIFDARLGAVARSHILLACVEQEHWRLKGFSPKPRAGHTFSHTDSRLE